MNRNSTYIGFDQLFDQLFDNMKSKPTSQPLYKYPPYNIIKHDDDKYVIEVATAGFSSNQIDISVENSILNISTTTDETADGSGSVEPVGNPPKIEYLHRGLAARSFKLAFTLDRFVEVTNAEMVNGVLTINLERIVPDSAKPKQITIQQK